MVAVTERSFYTILILALTVLAILLPVIVIQTEEKNTNYVYLRPLDANNDEVPVTDDLEDKYYTEEELIKYLQDFSKKRSILYTTQEIGKTKGDKPIQEIVLQKHAEEKSRVLVVSGILANDWGSVLTSIQLMNQFFADVKGTNHLLNNFQFHFLPLLNPAGYNFSMSLPIYSTWQTNYEGFIAGQHQGRVVLDGYEGGFIPKEVEIFKDYFTKDHDSIKAAFFLFTPQDFTYSKGYFTISSQWLRNNSYIESFIDDLINALKQEWNERKLYSLEYVKTGSMKFSPNAIMFYVKNPSALNKPWILSKYGDNDSICIPLEVTKVLKNYHIMAIEFLYHNYRKGIKGSILNQELDMNFPLQLSAFFRALVKGPAIILVVCSRQLSCFWHYHLVNHAGFDVIQVTSKNVKDSYKGDNRKLALLVTNDCLKLCEELFEHDFFSVVIEDLDQIAIKRNVKRLSGSFNVGLTYRSFYTDPDQKLQWNMLNWAHPGCVGKLQDFYEIDNNNFDGFNDNYRFWWLRLTWQFCESFEKPTAGEIENYQETVESWASENLSFTKKEEKKIQKRKQKIQPVTDEVISDSCCSIGITARKEEKRSRKRKNVQKFEPTDEIISDSCSSNGTVVTEVPMDKYVKLPSMDESPIVTSIIKNFEISPEPVLKNPSQLPYTQTHLLPYTQTQPHCSNYNDEQSVVLSFLEDQDKPSTSRSQSEDFIINLI